VTLGEIDAGVRVGEGREIRRDDRVVVGVDRGEAGELGAVEVHAEEVVKVGVLLRIKAADEEVDLPGLTVNAGDRANDLMAFRYLVFYLARSLVQMTSRPSATSSRNFFE